MNVNIEYLFERILSKTDGEQVTDDILEAFKRLTDYVPIDISAERSIIKHSYHGKAIRKAIGRALAKLAAYNETPIVTMGASDYAAMRVHDPDTTYYICKSDLLTVALIDWIPGRYEVMHDHVLALTFADHSSVISVRLYVHRWADNNIPMSIFFGSDLNYFMDDDFMVMYNPADDWYRILFYEEGSEYLYSGLNPREYIHELTLDCGCGTLSKDNVGKLINLKRLTIANNEDNYIEPKAFENCKNLKYVRIKMAPGSIGGYENYPWGAPKDCEFIWGGDT